MPRALSPSATAPDGLATVREEAEGVGAPPSGSGSGEAGRATPYAATLITAAGGLNPVRSVSPELDERLPISVEGLAALRPDVILLGEPATAPVGFREQLLADPALRDVPAVRDGRIHRLELARHGARVRSQRIVDVLAAVHRLLYP